MTANPATMAIRLDEKGGLIDDIACRKCGYNLRGLRTEGVCPECGTAVGRSLYGDFLRYCDPAWVRTLANGMNWIVAAVIARVVLGCAGGGMTGIAGVFAPRLTRFPLQSIIVVADVVALVGYWMATTADPAKAAQDGLSTRKVIRITKVCAVLGAIITPFAMQFASTVGSSVVVLGGAITVLDSLVTVVGTIAVFRYARSLALRIPDERTASQCRVVMWGLIGTQVALLAQVFLFIAASSGIAAAGGLAAVTGTAGVPASGPTSGTYLTRVTLGPGGTTVVSSSGSGASAVVTSMPAPLRAFPMPMALLGVVGCGFGVLSLVFTIWGLVLISRFRRAFLEQAATAERIWASTATPPPIARPSAEG